MKQLQDIAFEAMAITEELSNNVSQMKSMKKINKFESRNKTCKLLREQQQCHSKQFKFKLNIQADYKHIKCNKPYNLTLIRF